MDCRDAVQGQWRRFIGGPLDGEVHEVSAPRVTTVLPTPDLDYTDLAISPSSDFVITTTHYVEKTCRPCWSAAPVRLMIWEVMLDPITEDAYAVKRVAVDVFGTAAPVWTQIS